MANETGLLIEKSDVVGGVSKAGKQWQKISFVLKAKGKFPREVEFETLDPMLVQMVNDTSLNTLLTVEYSPESRKWNDRRFTSLRAWRVEVTQDDDFVHNGVKQMDAMYDGAPRGNKNSFQPQDDDLPF